MGGIEYVAMPFLSADVPAGAKVRRGWRRVTGGA